MVIFWSNDKTWIYESTNLNKYVYQKLLDLQTIPYNWQEMDTNKTKNCKNTNM
jgi:hypothetical protein